MKEFPAYFFPPLGGSRVELISLVSNSLWYLCLTLLLPGCIKDDLSDCPENLRIEFFYEVGMAGEMNVDRIDLYIFDSNGVFVDVVTDHHPDFSSGYTMLLPLLPKGEYRFVAWMGLGNGHSAFPEEFIPGETLFTEAKVVFDRPLSRIVDTHPEPLFHAILENAQVSGSKDQVFVMPVEQITNLIVVMIDDGSDETYRIAITDDNGSYHFDNSFAPDDHIEYTRTTERIDGVAQAELTVLKLHESRSPHMWIYRHDTAKSGYSPVPMQEPEPVHSLNLIELFNLIPDIDYRTTHRFEIRLGITGGSVNVSINGWQVNEEGKVILF